jgi:NADPH:quinone reductase-like Zn-dependent oxidoreductase
VPADDDAWKVIGWDASGIVKEVGADVTLLRLAMKSGMAGDITRQGLCTIPIGRTHCGYKTVQFILC